MSEYRAKRRKLFIEDKNDIIFDLIKNQELRFNMLLDKKYNELKYEISELKKIIKKQDKLLENKNTIETKNINDNQMSEDMRNAYI